MAKNTYTQKLLNSRDRYKSVAIVALVGFSLIWTILDWSRLDVLKEHAGDVALTGVLLATTEALFIGGALLMALSVGVELSAETRRHSWLWKIRHARLEARTLAGELSHSKIFGTGFWMNFAGAVGTSVLLIAVVFKYVPVAGWGLLLLLGADLAATFGWRIPLHLKRRAHLSANKIKVRRANSADIDKYITLQSARWSEDNTATREQLESRHASYPQGMLVAERGGEIVGMVYAMRITKYDYENPPSWYEITHDGFCDNADKNGTVIFGVDLSTAKGVGHLAGDKLLIGIGRLAIAEGVKTALLGGRMPGYHKFADKMTADEYLFAKDENGAPLDHQVKYYTGVPGLRAIKALPKYFNDPDSLDYGVLLKWRNPLYGLPFPRVWSALFPVLFRLEELYLKLSK